MPAPHRHGGATRVRATARRMVHQIELDDLYTFVGKKNGPTS
jgi:hypothetical protein